MKCSSLMLVTALTSAAYAEIATLESLVVETPTVLSGVTNIYTSTTAPGSIAADLVLDGGSYVRLKGSTAASAKSDFFLAPDHRDVKLTIKGNSAFFAAYCNSTTPASWKNLGLDQANTSAERSYISVHVGQTNAPAASTGSAKIDISGPFKGYGANLPGGLWLERLHIEPSASGHDTGYIDILEIGEGSSPTIGSLYQSNDIPARIIFKGGAYTRSNRCYEGSELFHVPKGKKLVLKGENGADIWIRKIYQQAGLSNCRMAYRGSIRFEGMNIRLDSVGNNSNNYLPYFLGIYNSIEWAHTGDLILANATLLRMEKYSDGVVSHNALPSGAGTGGIVMGGMDTGDFKYSCLDLYGSVQHVNSVTSIYADDRMGVVSNSLAGTTGVLVFGKDDLDGVFNAVCSDNVELEKIGSGTLAVSNAVVKTLRVKGGTVRFATDAKLDSLTLGAGTEVVCDAVKLTCSDFNADRTAVVRCLNGGELVVEAGKPAAIGLSTLSTSQSFTKAGDGEMLLHSDGTAAPQSLRIKSGKAVLIGGGESTDKYWRFVMKGSKVAGEVRVGDLILHHKNVQTSSSGRDYCVNRGLTDAPEGTLPEDLEAGQVTVSPSVKWRIELPGSGHHYSSPSFLFDGLAHWMFNPTNCNFATSAPYDDPSRHVEVAFRLADNAKPAYSYSLYNNKWTMDQELTAWRLESSADGRTWFVASEVDDAVAPAYTSATASSTGFDFYNGGIPYRFTGGHLKGAAALPAGCEVQVDAGALLDLSLVDGETIFGALALPLAGGGTITHFSAAEAGTLNIIALGEALPDGDFVLSMDFGSCSNMENIANWKVLVDGVENGRLRVSYVDGAFKVRYRKGMVVGVR